MNAPQASLDAAPVAPGGDAGWTLPGLDVPSTAGHYSELLGRSVPESAGPLSPADMAPHWRTFFDALARKTPDDLTQRLLRLRRMVLGNGISYNVYSDSQGAQRPWEVDLLPLLIPPAEWATLSAGILERAELLERILQDIYGRQELLRDGLLPSALVQGHPGYLRAMHGIAQRHYLHLVAFDLVRGPAGGWHLMTQRTQAPSGLGYLLENRHLVRQQFPDTFEQLGVPKLIHAYQALLTSLRAHCQPLVGAGETPTLVLLTPGQMNETWFEQAYLARFLGIPLVEGGDLRVHQEKLYLKTTQGLVRVHGLLRRVDDDWMDPLELRPESALGVAGLLQVLRAGNVVVANSPGSGFLESPAVLGFLPAIAEHLLGAPLQLPALATWWCGEEAVLPQALPRLTQMAIKPTYAGSDLYHGFASELGAHLRPDQLQDMESRIRQHGGDYTLQQYMPLSETACWRQDGASGAAQLTSRPVVLRVFAIRDGDGWMALPGGMARLAMGDTEIASMQRGGSSVDVWILPDSTASAADLPARAPAATAPAPAPSASTPRPHARHHAPELLISRMAENLFWLGRYTERSENTVRLSIMAFDRLSHQDAPGPVLLDWLWRVSLDQELLAPDAPHQGTAAALEAALTTSLCQDHTGLAGTILPMQNVTSMLRSYLSHQHWQLVQEVRHGFDTLHDTVSPAPAPDGSLPPLPAAQDVVSQLVDLSHALAAVTGVQFDRLPRGIGWQMLMLGRMVERLACVANTLQHALEQGVHHDAQASIALLSLFDNRQPQPRLHTEVLPTLETWRPLIANPRHPRSLHWTLGELRDLLHHLPVTSGTAHQPPASAQVPPVTPAPSALQDDAVHWPALQAIWPDLSAWEHATPDTATELTPDTLPDSTSLQALLQQCQIVADAINTAVSQTYFYPAADAISQSIGT